MSDKPDGQGLTVDLMLRPEWAARVGTDKSFRGVNASADFAEFGVDTYNVPVGKTLYITQVSFMSRAELAASGELNQIVSADIYDNTLLAFLWRQGGNGGGGQVLSKPIVVSGGTSVNFEVYNHANHSCFIEIFVAGYEI